MIILGIDPGIAILGYGIIDYNPGDIFRPIDYGCITTPADMRLPERLRRIYEGVSILIDNHRPDSVAIEELFFNKNVKTALVVGHARGAALVAAANRTEELFEYTPLQVKQAVTGYGRADKQQVQAMVTTILGLKEIPKPDDAADALAVAICHANSSGMPQSFKI